jgi:predicted permease
LPWPRLPLRNQAVFGLQSGMGNVGYTLGGAICFALWNMEGLSLEQIFCLMWPFYAFGLCFPLARHYAEKAAIGHGAAGGPPAPAQTSAGRLRGKAGGFDARLVWKSLTDLRSLPLYMAALGLALNLGGARAPQEVRRLYVVDALMIGGIFLQFGGVGMTVQVRRLSAFWKEALGTASLKMLLSPALMLGVGWAMGLEGVPLYVCLVLSAMPTALYSVLVANLFNLNRDQANTTFLLTHAACLGVVVPLIVLWSH